MSILAFRECDDHIEKKQFDDVVDSNFASEDEISVFLSLGGEFSIPSSVFPAFYPRREIERGISLLKRGFDVYIT